MKKNVKNAFALSCTLLLASFSFAQEVQINASSEVLDLQTSLSEQENSEPENFESENFESAKEIGRAHV